MKMTKYKKGLITLFMGGVLFFSACGANVAEGKELYTPEEAITSTMESLKSLDLESFNEYTDNYVDTTYRNWLGVPTREEYRVFSELLQPGVIKRKRYDSDYKLAQKIVESLSWEVKDIQEKNGKARISMEITNRDMLRAVGNYEISVWEDMIEGDGIGIGAMMKNINDMIEDYGGLIAAIDSLDDDEMCTMTVVVSAFCEDGQWRIHLSDEFINAFMGNMNAEEYPEDVKEKIAALEKAYEEKIERGYPDEYFNRRR